MGSGPEFPSQVAPLPPERQSIYREEQEEFCRSNPDYEELTVMVLGHESPLYSYRRGYAFISRAGSCRRRDRDRWPTHGNWCLRHVVG